MRFCKYCGKEMRVDDKEQDKKDGFLQFGIYVNVVVLVTSKKLMVFGNHFGQRRMCNETEIL